MFEGMWVEPLATASVKLPLCHEAIKADTIHATDWIALQRIRTRVYLENIVPGRGAGQTAREMFSNKSVSWINLIVMRR